MIDSVTPYPNSKLPKKEQIAKMFDNISGNYDILNRIISFGIDIKWREKVLQIVNAKSPKSILDIATGTGDLAILMTKISAAKIIGLDISTKMLELAKQKILKKFMSNKIELILGDSEKIPFKNNNFDAITVAFGLRNFENLNKGLSEIYRVLKPNGIFVILETSNPTKFPFKQGYKFYTNYILPTIGRLFSKDKVAYNYLSKSANKFPFGIKLCNILEKNEFIEVEAFPQSFGVATIYKASKK